MFVMGNTSNRWSKAGVGLLSRDRFEPMSAGTEWMKVSSPFMACSFSRAYSVSIGGKIISHKARQTFKSFPPSRESALQNDQYPRIEYSS